MALLADRAILLLAIGQTLVWAALYYIFPASLLLWESDLGWSRTELTLAITLAILTSAVAAPIAGRMIDNGRGPALMAATCVAGGVLIIAVSAVTRLWQFYALWALIGVCLAGCLYDACFSLVTRARGPGAKRAIVWITLVAGFAGSISFPVVHALGAAFGWRAATAGIGVGVIVVVAPVLWAGAVRLEAGNASTAPAPAPAERRFLRRPAFWLIGLGFGCAALVHGAVLHHLLPILDERGAPAQLAVLIAALIAPMQVVGRLIMVAVGDAVSHHRFTQIAFAAMGASVFLLLISGVNLLGLLPFVFFFGSAYGTVSILRPVLARDVLGQARFGAKAGSLALIYLAASAASAWLAALVWSVGGYPLMLSGLLVLTGIGAVLCALARRFA